MSRSNFMRARTLICAVVACGSALAADGEIELRLGQGLDSNPLRLSSAPPDAGFSEAALSGSLRVRPNPRFQFFTGGELVRRFHGSGMGDADTTRGRLSLGIAVVPWQRRSRYVTVIAGLKQRLFDSTYVDPRTGDVFEYSESDGNGGTITAAVPGRLSYDGSEAYLRLRWKFQRRWRLSLSARAERRDYGEADPLLQTLEPLDYGATTFEPGIRWTPNKLLTVDLSAFETRRDYDRQLALDGSGAEVPGVLRRYTYSGYRLSLRIEPSDRLDLRVGYRDTNRADVHAGYYDSGTDSSYLSYRGWLGERTYLTLFVSRQQLAYDNALAPATSDPRTGEVLTARFELERRIRGPLAWYVEGGVQQSDNNDPLFAYDRNWGSTGIALKFERGRSRR